MDIVPDYDSCLKKIKDSGNSLLMGASIVWHLFSLELKCVSA